MIKWLFDHTKVFDEEKNFITSKIKPEFKKFFDSELNFLADKTLSKGYIEVEEGFDYFKETLLHLLALALVSLTKDYPLTANISMELTGENFLSWKESVFNLFTVSSSTLWKFKSDEEKFFKANASISDVNCIHLMPNTMWKYFDEQTEKLSFHFDKFYLQQFKEKFRISDNLETFTEQYLYMNTLLSEEEIKQLYQRYKLEVCNNPFNSKSLENHSLMVKQIGEMFKFCMLDNFFSFEKTKEILLNQLKLSVNKKKDFYIKSLQPLDFQTFLESQFFFYKNESMDVDPEELFYSELNRRIVKTLDDETRTGMFESFTDFKIYCEKTFKEYAKDIALKYCKDYVQTKITEEKEYDIEELLEEIKQDPSVSSEADIKEKLNVLIKVSRGKKKEAYEKLYRKYFYYGIALDF